MCVMKKLIIHYTKWYVIQIYFMSAIMMYKLQVESKNPRLIKHPVVLVLLEKKLNTFGWPFYYLNLLLYSCFLALLIALLFLMPNPQSQECKTNIQGPLLFFL